MVVGIGYRVNSIRIRGLAQWAAWRTRDLTPVRIVETDQYWKERLSALLEGEDLVFSPVALRYFSNHSVKISFRLLTRIIASPLQTEDWQATPTEECSPCMYFF